MLTLKISVCVKETRLRKEYETTLNKTVDPSLSEAVKQGKKTIDQLYLDRYNEGLALAKADGGKLFATIDANENIPAGFASAKTADEYGRRSIWLPTVVASVTDDEPLR